MRDAWELQDHLDTLVVELDQLSKDQDRAANDEGLRLDRWEVILDEFTEQLQGEYDQGDHKGAFPGKDRLESMCRAASPGNREAWRSLKRASLRLEKATRRASNVKQQIGGLQSTLKTLGTEAQAPRPRSEPEGHTFGARAA
jgi:chromosome segregation ATPase